MLIYSTAIIVSICNLVSTWTSVGRFAALQCTVTGYNVQFEPLIYKGAFVEWYNNIFVEYGEWYIDNYTMEIIPREVYNNSRDDAAFEHISVHKRLFYEGA